MLKSRMGSFSIYLILKQEFEIRFQACKELELELKSQNRNTKLEYPTNVDHTEWLFHILKSVNIMQPMALKVFFNG